MERGIFFMIQQIVKRDGRMAPLRSTRSQMQFSAQHRPPAARITIWRRSWRSRSKTLEETAGTETPTVEQVQDTVEKVLIESGHARTAKKYILYRKRAHPRA